MTNPLTPPWLDGPVPHTAFSPPVQPSGRFQKGQSGNPAGRPRGVPDARTKITRALMEDGVAVAKVVTEAALGGDLHACNIVLARIAPSLRSEAAKVQFAFDASASIPAQIEAVLCAVADGLVAPDVGRDIAAAIGTLADARAVADLEARIITLEAKEIR